jgi:hypothetical protein
MTAVIPVTQGFSTATHARRTRSRLYASSPKNQLAAGDPMSEVEIRLGRLRA